jgi:DNA mismatch endonuclease, patch repair protein
VPYKSWASNDAVRASMQGNRSRDTSPELALRRELHKLGLRYRVNIRPIGTWRGTADVVFTRRRVVVFVDGCFWHGCPDHYKAPKTTGDFWQNKLVGNVTRDRLVQERLEEAGWEVIRVWEHESPAEAAAQIAETIRKR